MLKLPERLLPEVGAVGPRLLVVAGLVFSCVGLDGPRVHAAAAQSVSSGSGVQWQVVESTPERLRLRVDITGESLVENPATGWTSISIPGAPSGNEPGLPSLPHAGRWIALPPSGKANLRVEAVRTETLGSLRVEPVPTPRIDRDAPIGEPRLREERLEGPDYASYRTTRADVVELGTPIHSRRQRMAALRIQPVLFDGASGRAEIVRSVEITIEFPGVRGMAGGEVPQDPTVRGLVLNPDTADAWTTYPPRLEAMREASRRGDSLERESSATTTIDPASLLADPVRIRVEDTDLYRVQAIELLLDLEVPETITREQIRLVKLRPTQPEEPGYPAPSLIDVPVHFLRDPDPTDTLEFSDEIVFYGLSIKDEWERWQALATEPAATPGRPDHFNGANVYFLLAQEPSGSGWSRMESVDALAYDGANVATEYLRVERFEEDRGYQEDPLNLDVERYHWNVARTSNPTFGSVRTVAPIPGRDMKVRYTAARSPDLAGSARHRFQLWDEDSVLSDLGARQLVSWTGGLVPFESTVSTDDVVDGAMRFSMSREGTTGFVAGYFGYVELEYPAAYVATSNRLRFGLPTVAGDYDLEVTGFSDDDLVLFDVTESGAPRVVRLPEGAIVDDGGDVSVRVRLTQAAPGRSYMLSSALRIPETPVLERDPVVDIVGSAAPVQVLVVGPSEFRSESERYIEFRRDRIGGRDWELGFFDVQQLYDQFTGGLQSPHAIREFAAYAYAQWNATALVIMGDAGEDAREVTGYGSPNRVPISMHIQRYDGQELLASDKWFGIFGDLPTRYPADLERSSDILVGRLPAGSVDELRTMVDKIIAYETVDTEGDWRQRSLWISDDAYSGGYIGGSQSNYCEVPSERAFASSQDRSAGRARGPFDGTLQSTFLNLDDYTRDFRPPPPADCADLGTVSQGYDSSYRSEFLSVLNQGHLIVSYQGHANYDLLGHEVFLRYLDGPSSNAPLGLNNTGRPFVFFGMGCHVSDFCQADEAFRRSPSIGEQMVREPNRGAIATYGSSGFEFLTPNAALMETIALVLFGPSRASSPVLGDDIQSQWLLGETLAQAEFDVLAAFRGNETYAEMIGQYNLLGDPLTRLDAAPPRLQARWNDDVLGNGTELTAAPGDTSVTIQITAADESGVDRVEIGDDRGRTWFTATPGNGDTNLRQIVRNVVLPLRPQEYTLELAVFDESYPTLARGTLTLPVRLDLRVFVNGEELDDPSTLQLDPNLRTPLEVTFRTPIDLDASEVEATFEGVDLQGLSIEGGPRVWTVSALAAPRAGETIGSFSLVLDGETTVIAAPDEPGPTGSALALVQHAPVPSPFAERTYVTAEVEGVVEGARLTVYDLSGRPVYSSNRYESHDVPSGDRTLRAVTMEWEARDDLGDEVANGTYLYRIEVDGPTGRVRSEMGRVVVMR